MLERMGSKLERVSVASKRVELVLVTGLCPTTIPWHLLALTLGTQPGGQ